MNERRGNDDTGAKVFGNEERPSWYAGLLEAAG